MTKLSVQVETVNFDELKNDRRNTLSESLNYLLYNIFHVYKRVEFLYFLSCDRGDSDIVKMVFQLKTCWMICSLHNIPYFSAYKAWAYLSSKSFSDGPICRAAYPPGGLSEGQKVQWGKIPKNPKWLVQTATVILTPLHHFYNELNINSLW